MTSRLYRPARCACARGKDGIHFTYLEPVVASDGDPHLLLDVNFDAEPMEAPVPIWRTAVHEASHAVGAYALGRNIESVTVVGQAMAVIGKSEQDDIASASISMAGPHGETLIVDRRLFRPFNSDAIRSFNAVRDFRFGGCDACNIAFAIVHHHGLDDPDRDLLATYRSVETATIEVLFDEAIQIAIRALADELLRAGTLQGRDAELIFESAGVALNSRQDIFREVIDEHAGTIPQTV